MVTFVAFADGLCKKFSWRTEKARLHRAGRSHGPGTLLFVREAPEGGVAGQVKRVAPGLLIGTVDRLVNGEATWDSLSAECWLTVCQNAAALVDQPGAGSAAGIV